MLALLAGGVSIATFGCSTAEGPTLASPNTTAPDSPAAQPTTDTTDPTTPPFELNLDGLADQHEPFVLELPADDVRRAMENADAVAEEMAEAAPETTEPAPAPTATAQPDQPADQPVERATPHRLEEIVIDDTPDELQPEFIWDEPAALACAHTEFALDALIAADAAALDETLDAAADWAEQSSNAELSTFAPELASTRDIEAEDLVVNVLSTCADAGYEL